MTNSKPETTPKDSISRWINRKPDSASKIRVVIKKLAGIEVVLEYSSVEVERLGPDETAYAILDTAEATAEQMGKIVSFYCQWIDEENKAVLTLPFRITPENAVSRNDLSHVDGSLEGLIASLQSAGIQKDRIMLECIQALVSLFIQLVELQQGRIAYLEGQEIEVRRLKNELIELGNDGDSQERFKQFTNLMKDILVARNPNPASVPVPGTRNPSVPKGP